MVSASEAPTRGPARVLPYLISGILIAIGIIFPLIVPIYARTNPTLGGIPFFYWYQMLWVFIDAGLLWIVYAIIRREDDRRRAAVARPIVSDSAAGAEADK
jgi:Protein of unknown function (DUF3311)